MAFPLIRYLSDDFDEWVNVTRTQSLQRDYRELFNAFTDVRKMTFHGRLEESGYTYPRLVQLL